MQTLLDGIQVVELTEALAGPYCAMLLGDMGASVIKVERLGKGDQSRGWGPPFLGSESAYFLATNRNKRSIALNYDTAEGMEILQKLLLRADVFLCNQPSRKSLEKRGLDAESLRAKNPRLIYCGITGYGFTGPRAGRPGYDILAQAEAGVMSFTGEPGGEPMRFPIAIADMTTGMYATMGVLAALYKRERTGKGDKLDMALFDSQLTWLANVGSSYLNCGQSPERWGNAHPNIVPYQLFRGSDGKYLVVGVGTEEQWPRLLTALGAPVEFSGDARFATNALRIQNRDALIPKLQELFGQRSAAEWLAKLLEADVPATAIQDVGEALSDAQAIARGMIVEMEHPVLKTVRSVANPIRLQDQPMSYRLPPPMLGEHSREILCELGYSAHEADAAMKAACSEPAAKH